MRDNLLLPGDYVKYTGDYSIETGPLRNSGLARVEGLRRFYEVERINLFLPDSNSQIWCDYDKVRIITTEEKHLLHCGFSLETVGNFKRYRLGRFIISGCSLQIVQMNYYFLSGYCIADFTIPGIINIGKYLKEDEIDINLFHSDFPSVNNINELFTFLTSIKVQFDAEQIAKL